MKIFYTLLFCSICFNVFAQVGIGTANPAPSAKLDITSTNQGLLPPRMTTTQRDGIASPAAGLMIYNTSSNEIEFFNGSSWSSISSLLGANLPVKRLYGTYASEYIHDLKETPDGGFIFVGYTVGYNNGSLTGINSNGNNDCWVVKLDAKGIIQWQKLLGSSASDVGYSVINTSDGGYAITGSAGGGNGSFTGAIFNNGPTDAFLIKLDVSGNIQWQKLYGGSLTDIGYSLGQTTDGGFVIAGASNSSNTGTLTGFVGNGGFDSYIIKTDASGNILWQKLAGGNANDLFNSMQVCSDGSLIFLGNSASSSTGTLLGVSNNGIVGTNDSFILKLTSAGTLLWQKLLGGSSEEYGNFVSQTADNGFLLISLSNSNGTGTLTGTVNNGSYDAWIVKIDVNGNLLWQAVLGGSGYENPYFVKETSDNGFLVTGYSNSSNSGTIPFTSNGNNDVWVIKLNTNGSTAWQKLYGGGLDDLNRTAAILPDGSIMLGSYSNSSNTGTLTGLLGYGSNDGWLFKIDKYGNPF